MRLNREESRTILDELGTAGRAFEEHHLSYIVVASMKILISLYVTDA